MNKNVLEKIVIDEDLKSTGVNFTAAYVTGKLASMASSALFGFNLNQFNSIDHFAMGVGIGTFAYRKAGRGVKGVLAGLAAATIFNVIWEGFEEGFNPYHNPESMINTISDIAVVYAGTTLSFVGEKIKSYITKDKK
jgi:hypothetical protein